MIQPLRGRIRPVGYFLRGATQFAAPRTVAAIARFVMGILFAAFERSVAGIREAVADSPTASALRQFLGSRELLEKLVAILRWKTRQNLRKALRRRENRTGSIILALDSTLKGTLSRRARHRFFPGHGERVGQHIFVCGLLLFPDGTRLPLGPLQKKGGRHAPTQVDLAAVLVRLYARRWQIELFFREAKSYLGFDQSRVTGEYGPGNFALLVTLAYQFLHWSGTAAERAQTTLARLRALTADVATDNYEVLERAVATRHRRKKFRERFHPHAPSSAHGSRRAKTRIRRIRLAS